MQPIKTQIKYLRTMKAQSGIKLNKIANALNRAEPDVELALHYVEQHRELNERHAQALNALHKMLYDK